MDISKTAFSNEETLIGKRVQKLQIKTKEFIKQLSQLKVYAETKLKDYDNDNAKFTAGGQTLAILKDITNIAQKSVEEGIDSTISTIKLEMENCSDSNGEEKTKKLDKFFKNTLTTMLSDSLDPDFMTPPDQAINKINEGVKKIASKKTENIEKYQNEINENRDKLVSDIVSDLFEPGKSQSIKELKELGKAYAIAALSYDIYHKLEIEKAKKETTDPREKIINDFLARGNTIDFKKEQYKKMLIPQEEQSKKDVSFETMSKLLNEEWKNHKNTPIEKSVVQKQEIDKTIDDNITKKWETEREYWVKKINVYLSSNTGLALVEQTALIREIQSSGNGGLETVEERDPNNPARVTVTTRVKDTLNLSEAIEIYNAIMLAQAKTNADESSKYFSEAEIKSLIEEGKGKSIAEQVEISRRINKRGMIYVTMRNELVSELIFENSKTLYNKVVETHHYFKIDPKRFETILTEDEWYKLYLLIFGKSAKEENRKEDEKVEIPPPPIPS